MKVVFADSAYWWAIIDWSDPLHEQAMALTKQLGPLNIVTTEFILVEVLNSLCKNIYLKQCASGAIDQMLINPLVTVVPSSQKFFMEAFELYKQMQDKHWSLVDCSSFIIMKRKRITEALTYDKHFEQAGFKALLREKSS